MPATLPAQALGWKRAAGAGAAVGLLALPCFLLLHAAIVTPIWTRVDAILRGLVLAPLTGALLGVAFDRLLARAEPRFLHDLGGMLLGALAGLTLAPFALVGWMRARGAPDAFWILILGLLVTSFYHVTQAVQENGGRWRRLELPAALVLANAFPAYFLTFIGDFHEEMPEPFAFTAAVATLYVAGGAALTLVRRRMERR